MQCEHFQKLLEPYLEERLDEAKRRVWREHLSACDACRRWATDQEPSLLFVSLVRPAADSARAEQCTDTVMALIRQERLQHRLRRPRQRRAWMAAAAIFLILVAAAVLWLGDVVQPATIDGLVAEETGEPVRAPQVEVDMDDAGIRAYYFADNDKTMAGAFIVNPALEL